MRAEKLEMRIIALENAVARLKRDIEREKSLGTPWWEQIAGTFTQDRMYKAAMRLGRQQRHTDNLPSGMRRVREYGRARHRSS